MTTVASVPGFAVPERPTSIVFGLTEFSSNWVRVWAMSAPSGSKLDVQINDGTGRTEIYAGQGGTGHPLATTFDKGGHYVFAAQEYVKGASANGGGYQDSPDSAPSEMKVGAEATLNLYIGQRMTSSIGSDVDTATLVLWVWNDSVRETLITIHGEDSPAILEPRSPKAAAAAVATPVTDALAALVGQTDPAGNIGTIVTTLRNKIALHMAAATVHSSPDTINPLPAAFATDPGQHLDDFVNAQLASLRAHFDNVGANLAAPFGPGSASYHSALDRLNAPIVQSAGDQSSAYIGAADVWRSYEAHRVSSVHATPDLTHTLGTVPKLLALHIAFLNELAANASTPAPGQSTAAMKLIQKAGFEET